MKEIDFTIWNFPSPGIKQATVNAAPTFPAVLSKFVAWASRANLGGSRFIAFPMQY